jgi:hypothetical protein
MENSIKLFFVKSAKDFGSLLILSWLVLLYGVTIWLVLGSLSSIQFQARLKSISQDGKNYSVYQLLELSEKNYANKSQRDKIVQNFLKLHSEFDTIVKIALVEPQAERQKKFQSVKDTNDMISRETVILSKDVSDLFDYLKTSNNEINAGYQKISTKNDETTALQSNEMKDLIEKVNIHLKRVNSSVEKLYQNYNVENKNSQMGTSISSLNKSVKEFGEYDSDINKRADSIRADIKKRLDETNQIYEEFQKSSSELEKISDESKDLLGELAYLRFMKFNFLAIMPSQLLTLLLTLSMGALGSVIFLTREFFGGKTNYTISWYLFRPFLGMVTAISIFVLVKSGQLVLSDSKEGIGSETLNPFFISFLAIISGLLSEQAYEKIHLAGESFLNTGKSKETERWGFHLGELLAAKNKSIDELSLFVGVDKSEIESWVLEKAPINNRHQEIISAYLAVPIREIFTDIEPAKSNKKIESNEPTIDSNTG